MTEELKKAIADIDNQLTEIAKIGSALSSKENVITSNINQVESIMIAVGELNQKHIELGKKLQTFPDKLDENAKTIADSYIAYSEEVTESLRNTIKTIVGSSNALKLTMNEFQSMVVSLRESIELMGSGLAQQSQAILKIEVESIKVAESLNLLEEKVAPISQLLKSIDNDISRQMIAIEKVENKVVGIENAISEVDSKLLRLENALSNTQSKNNTNFKELEKQLGLMETKNGYLFLATIISFIVIVITIFIKN